LEKNGAAKPVSKHVDQIVYPGSDQYTADEISAPGSQPIELYGEPILRAVDTAYIMFQVPNLKKQKSFLEDFGMVLTEETESEIYMRGYGPEPYIYVACKGSSAKYLGVGLVIDSDDELERIANATDTTIENIPGPGKGRRVRLIDPDGFFVDLTHGREKVSELKTRREALLFNLPSRKSRVNRAVREPIQPSAVERFGHVVLMVSDFERSWKWYRRHLGLLPTDVLCSDVGLPLMSFNRFDKGSEPVDHHAIVLSSGPEAAHLHSAFETIDQDAIGQGQQYLKQRGWTHFWGIGRHILGSQLFDYWIDPHGNEIEHYADGDVFNQTYQTHYHLFDRGGLWAWGDDVPAAMNPKPNLKLLVNLLLCGESRRKVILAMKKAMGRAPRSWIKK
jgi:catechol 2,3-dioxygenase-like lactoylglutathione lyase family enzyme